MPVNKGSLDFQIDFNFKLIEPEKSVVCYMEYTYVEQVAYPGKSKLILN